MRECLGANQIRLLEFQPGEVVDLDHRIQRASGVFAAPGAVLTVQIGVRRHVIGYPPSAIIRNAVSYNARACNSKRAIRSTASPPISLAMNKPSAPAMA